MKKQVGLALLAVIVLCSVFLALPPRVPSALAQIEWTDAINIYRDIHAVYKDFREITNNETVTVDVKVYLTFTEYANLLDYYKLSANSTIFIVISEGVVTLPNATHYGLQPDQTLSFTVEAKGAGSLAIDDVARIGVRVELWSAEYAHDVAVDDAKTVCGASNEYEIHKTVVCQNYTATFNVTVQNIGDFDENSIIVLAIANGTQFDSTMVSSLPVNSNETLSFTWNTTVWQKGNYTVGFNATITIDDNNANNYVELLWPIAVTIVGDINNDRKVDMRDTGSAARAFGSIPTSLNWYANADINNDGKVDMKDIGTAAKHFGETHL